MLIVGAGGSFSSALVIKQMLEIGYGTSEIDAVTPQTAIKKLKQFSSIIEGKFKTFYNVVIAISYSGKTPDIHKVYEVCKNVGIEFILITKESDLSEMYPNHHNIISYYNKNDYTGNERGMISMAATLSPIAIFEDLNENFDSNIQKYLDEGKRFVDRLDISAIAASLKKAPVVNLFFDLDTMPTAYDI